MPPKKKNAINAVDLSTLSDRLDQLERIVGEKDNEIAELREKTDSLVEKIRRQDGVIADLHSKLEDASNNDPVALSLADIPVTQPKDECDLLVIGDSIVRDLNPSTINPGGVTEIKCLPGARPVDVASEFRKMTNLNTYKRILVHVGTNLVPKYSPSYVADEIVRCMETIRELSPNSKIAFSHLLPKENNALLPGIDFINGRVSSSGSSGPPRTRFGFNTHAAHFTDRFRRVDPSLFKSDGIHLSNFGVKAFNNSVKVMVSKNKPVA